MNLFEVGIFAVAIISDLVFMKHKENVKKENIKYKAEQEAYYNSKYGVTNKK